MCRIELGCPLYCCLHFMSVMVYGLKVSKIQLSDASTRVDTAAVLVYVWESCLRALHPFMPFVTEVPYVHRHLVSFLFAFVFILGGQCVISQLNVFQFFSPSTNCTYNMYNMYKCSPA